MSEELATRRDPYRQERLLSLVRQLWSYDDDARLLQLLLNVVPTYRSGSRYSPSDPYHYEDDELEQRLLERLAELRGTSDA